MSDEISETGHPDQTRRLPPDENVPAAQPRVYRQPPPNPGPRRQTPPPAQRRPRPQPSSVQQPVRAPVNSAPQQAPVRRASSQRPVQRPSDSGLYLPWWSLVVMVGMVGLVAFGLIFTLGKLGEPQTPGDQPPRIQMITSQPTLSGDFVAAPEQGESGLWPTAIPQVQPSATVPLPTPVPSPSLPPGEFRIGARVQVVGVEGSGLNVRASAGYDGSPRFLAHDEEVYVLVDGPQDADGLEWWRIEDPNDAERFGWAARNYLMIVLP
ncbi:MAG: SH3 domain-containing protein [Anaerolineae bacterium]|nr:SH3 domain-containing protein [Anaerolineae bacterium]